MQAKFVEATNKDAGGFNWGKFMVCRFSEAEWAYRSTVLPERSLLSEVGWDRKILFVCDLQTGEGAIFKPGGLAEADLNKHKVWVCPMFEPFLTWLYAQDLTDLDQLPALVQIKSAESAFSGYRRSGL